MRTIPNKIPSIPFTKDAYEKIGQELKRLTKLREEVVIRLSVAREMGDLSENGAYRYAKQELGDISRQLRDIHYKLRFGHVVQRQDNKDTIGFGSTITLKNDTRTLTFLLVSEYESNPKENKLSMSSPIGKAVFGKKVGDIVEVALPSSTVTYTISDVT